MFSKALMAFGLLALVMASPETFGDQFLKCDQGRFNSAAGFCVSEGAD
jgi:hypothetical protein